MLKRIKELSPFNKNERERNGVFIVSEQINQSYSVKEMIKKNKEKCWEFN